MSGRVERICSFCGSNFGFSIGDDGFYYCGYCNSQADDIFDTGNDEEEVINHYNASAKRRLPTNPIGLKPIEEPISQVKLTTSQLLDHPTLLNHPNFEDAMNDGVGPTQPSEVVDTVGITSLPSEDSLSERRRKLDFLEMQEELIKEEEDKEEEELARKNESAGAEVDVALKEMSNPTAREAQEQARARALDKQEQLCELSRALAVLASASVGMIYL